MEDLGFISLKRCGFESFYVEDYCDSEEKRLWVDREKCEVGSPEAYDWAPCKTAP
jgi:hypothetical protein